MIRELNDAPGDIKMYKSIKMLRKPNHKSNIIVHDDKGKSIVNEKEKYQTVKKKSL